MKYNSSAYWPVVRSMIKWSDNTVLRNYFVKHNLPCVLLHLVTCGNSEVCACYFPFVFMIVSVRYCVHMHTNST